MFLPLKYKKKHPAATFFLSYIVAAADGHVGVTWGDSLGRAGARQVVVVDAVGVVAGDGGEGVQRQIPVLQTATHTHTYTQRKTLKRVVYLVSVVFIVSSISETVNKHIS